MLAVLTLALLLASPTAVHATIVAYAAEHAIYEVEPFHSSDDVTHQEVVVSGLGFAQDVTYAGGRYYWTDVETGKLETALRDGSDRHDVVARDPSGAVPRFLEVDAAADTIYWTEVDLALISGDARIYRADLDGSNQELLYTAAGVGSSFALGGIVLDRDAGRIYFHDADASGSRLLSLSLDGSDLDVLATLSAATFATGGAIDFDPAGDRIFVSVGVQIYSHSLGPGSTSLLFDDFGSGHSPGETFPGLAYVADENALYVNYSEWPVFAGASHRFRTDADTGGFGDCACGDESSNGGVTLVPEPGTLLLVALGLAPLAVRRAAPREVDR
jgi:hypothetical protein